MEMVQSPSILKASAPRRPKITLTKQADPIIIPPPIQFRDESFTLPKKTFDKSRKPPQPITKISKEHKGYYLREYIKDQLGNSHIDEYDTIEEVLQKINEFHSDGIFPGGIVYEKKLSKNRNEKFTIRKGTKLLIPGDSEKWKNVVAI
jgi:hypothetical protein